MKKLIILTVGYPYGTYEPFLKGELYYHKNAVIVSSYIGSKKDETYNLPSNLDIEVWHPESKFFTGNKFSRVYSAIRCLVTPIFWKEFFSEEIRPISIRKVVQLLSCISKAKEIEKFVTYKLKKNNHAVEYIFYSYWMNQLALAAVLLAKKHKGLAISRCHGYDLYKRKENNDFVTFQKYLTQSLDKIFPISQNGKDTLTTLFPSDNKIRKKIVVERLGTKDHGISVQPAKNTIFTIVSCSNVISLKRVDLIFDALKCIDNFDIKWIHFGSGPLLEGLIKRVEAETTRHTICLAGYTSNENVMKFYKEHPVHLFLNVSESEGIPVSIMEALSFGIPCIATNVGGVHEIVKDSFNGKLIDKDCTCAEVSDVIKDIKKMPFAQYKNMRINARMFWEQNYSEENNYYSFSKVIERLKNE